MTICKEMKKFREILDSNGIEWTDMSQEWPTFNGKTDYICCTRFKIGADEFSVINGCGTYGGYSGYINRNKGLLEYWCMTNEDFEDPTGHLTAEETWRKVEETVNG